uniref:Uncharacterized protein n=1 Tax=Curvibacter symbiont subsp. Hydra magnipapillata TaxID=667019 RepID=C9Y8Z5_CURXX|nr:hypothetical protein Csp_A05960 [Curvibacter putative symbiont of Hydra magnipapillata]
MLHDLVYFMGSAFGLTQLRRFVTPRPFEEQRQTYFSVDAMEPFGIVLLPAITHQHDFTFGPRHSKQ